MKQQNNKQTLEELIEEVKDRLYEGGFTPIKFKMNNGGVKIINLIKKAYEAGRDSDIRAYCEMCHVFINVHTGERTK